MPEAVLSPLLVLLPIPKVDVRGDEDAEEGGGVDHVTRCPRHPVLRWLFALQVQLLLCNRGLLNWIVPLNHFERCCRYFSCCILVSFSPKNIA